MNCVEPCNGGVWGEAPAARHFWHNLGRFCGFGSIVKVHVLNASNPAIVLFWNHYRQSRLQFELQLIIGLEMHALCKE